MIHHQISDSGLFRLSRAIAKAEGFFRDGSRPQRNHNPGDLTIDTTGKGVSKDGQYIVYRTDGDGWDALEKQVWLMLTGKSRHYNPEMTIEEVGRKWTTTDQDAWIKNVSQHLGVTRYKKIGEIE